MNTGAPWPSLDEAWRRVLEIQTKLHRWAGEDRSRRFDDLFNLVTDPAFLMVAWVVHIDEGFDFLGFRIQRHRKRGTGRRCVYTYPSKKAVTAIKDKVRTLTHSSAQADLTALLERVNGVLRGWSNYFKHGVSKRTFSYLGAFTWRRTAIWIRKRHKGLTWKQLRRRFMAGGWTITDGQLTLFNPASVTVTRYRRRSVIPNPWTPPTHRLTQPT